MFKPGTYYIGDPCYVIKDWDRFLDELHLLEEGVDEALDSYDGRRVYVATTAYGDGSYYDEERHEYSVDAGLLSCIPIELCTREDYDLNDLGRIVTFDKPFRAYCSERGVFHIGHINIDTKNDPEEEDDYYDRSDAWDDEDGDYERR